MAKWFTEQEYPGGLLTIRTNARLYQPIGEQGKPKPEPVPGYVARHLLQTEALLAVEAVNKFDHFRELQEAAEAVEETLTRQGYSENDIDTRGGAALMALRAALASVKGEGA